MATARTKGIGPIKVRLARPIEGQWEGVIYLGPVVYADVLERLQSTAPEEEIVRGLVADYAFTRRVIDGIREYAGLTV